MYKKILFPLAVLGVAYLLMLSQDAKIIVAGVAVFLIGMVFMEDGFKLFSGGILEKVLQKSMKVLLLSVILVVVAKLKMLSYIYLTSHS